MINYLGVVREIFENVASIVIIELRRTIFSCYLELKDFVHL